MARDDTVAVVGAGVIGAAAAYALTREGRTVLLLDRAEPGMTGASFGNAGHIAAELVEPLPSWDLLFGFWRELFGGLKRALPPLDPDQRKAVGKAYKKAGSAPWNFDLEILMQENGPRIDADLAFAIVDRIAWVSIDESAFGDELTALRRRELFHCLGRREHEWKQEEAECDSKGRPEHPAKQKNCQPTPHKRFSSNTACHAQANIAI